MNQCDNFIIIQRIKHFRSKKQIQTIASPIPLRHGKVQYEVLLLPVQNKPSDDGIYSGIQSET